MRLLVAMLVAELHTWTHNVPALPTMATIPHTG
eukprot:CAMPEP_0115183262 /NCGR_PEP_ID=MMETSP0270-20121206/8365_1 /TAXON_ID=71861 /ORGANISM="Scrippsiella trochoidea, Strain CCMP3099" /LENGTH=32 /DNA_ID= /DNA_START= /DNA_END= /DNA_ORIENTATION=